MGALDRKRAQHTELPCFAPDLESGHFTEAFDVLLTMRLVLRNCCPHCTCRVPGKQKHIALPFATRYEEIWADQSFPLGGGTVRNLS